MKGYARVEKLSWENYNEGIDFIEQAKVCRQRYGFYPEAISADKIYRNHENSKFCKDHDIRLSGPRLGRPNEKKLKEQKRLERIDGRIRNAVEGKFGEGKRRYGLGCIMAKLKETSESVILLQFLVMNLEHAPSSSILFFQGTIFAIFYIFRRICFLN